MTNNFDLNKYNYLFDQILIVYTLILRLCMYIIESM